MIINKISKKPRITIKDDQGRFAWSYGANSNSIQKTVEQKLLDNKFLFLELVVKGKVLKKDKVWLEDNSICMEELSVIS